MTKIYQFGCVFFFAAALLFGLMYGYANSKVNRQATKISSLEMEVKQCKEEVKQCKDGIKEFNDAQIRAGDTIQKVREVVRTVKSDCDCYNIAVNKRILDRVRKR